MLNSMILIGFGLLLAAILRFGWSRLASFRAQSPADYAATEPSFDIRSALNGSLQAEGVIYGPMGRIAARFTGRFTGTWDGNRGKLREEFSYATGNKQTREWNLEIGNNGKIRATAADVIGTGTGAHSGATVMLNYRLKLAEDAGGHVLDVTDWMYLMENGSIMNKSEMRKFGIKVAELVATIRPAAVL